MSRKTRLTLKDPQAIPEGRICITGLTLVNPDGTVVDDGALAIGGTKIIDCGETAEVKRRRKDSQFVDGRGFLAGPGLVNGHTHCAMGFFRGLGHGKSDLIEKYMFPAEKSLTAELTGPLSWSYLVAGVKSGVTCFCDHYYFSEGIGRAMERLGVRGVIGETIADLGGAFPSAAKWTEARKTIENWPLGELITPAIAPHATDTVSAALLREMAAYAKKNKLPLHMHLSQTAGERRRVLKREGLSPVQYAERCGALGRRTMAVHLVTADEEDLAILAKRKVTIGFCPASQIIYEKLAPVAGFLKHGIPLAIGTDCAFCNDGSDMMSELKLTALLAEDRGAEKEYLKPAKLLPMAGLNALKVFGLDGKVGTLAKARLADVVFYELDIGCHPMPLVATNLIYSMSAQHVRHVIVNGKWVLWNRQLASIDEQDLAAEFEAAVVEIKRRVRM